MKTIPKLILLAILTTSQYVAKATKKNVLFLGNSYTFYNDLPKLVAEIASSMGDTLIYDSNMPGGYTLQQHSTDFSSLAKIDIGNWDFVVLQEQSQRPSFPISQVIVEVFPYAKILSDRIKSKNKCAEPIFYMTWGRKNGDASNCPFFPAVCTYEGMDDLLRERYITMGNDNKAIISPVGPVWRNVRKNYPTMELYDADASHPSLLGSYAAALSFYTVIFKKDATSASFISSLTVPMATNLKTAVKKVVYDSLAFWNVGKFTPCPTADCSVPAASVYTFNYKKKKYEIIKEKLNWVDAAACAVSRGGFLAEIGSKEEQDSIFHYSKLAGITAANTVAPDGGGASYLWIGGNDLATEGRWVWDGDNKLTSTNFYNGTYPTGTAVAGLYNNWGKEPDDAGGQDGLGLAITNWPLGTSGQWNDVSANNQLYYVVEYPAPSAIEQPSIVAHLNIYPNPVTDKLYISNLPNGIDRIAITDVSGRICTVPYSLLNNQIEIASNTLSPGLYFIEVASKDQVYRGKFVKN